MTVLSLNDPFEVLGVDRETSSLKDIKQAYSVKLKQTRPEDDAEGFMALRGAYDQARNVVRWRTQAAKEEISNFAAEASVSQSNSSEIEPDSEKQIQYQYDDGMDTWVPVGEAGDLVKLLHQWVRKEEGSDPDGFFKKFLAVDDHTGQTELLSEKSGFEAAREWLLQTIATDGEMPGIGQQVVTPFKLKRPKWLCDSTVVYLHHHLKLLDFQPINYYTAIRQNAIIIMMEPILRGNGKTGVELPQHDEIAYLAKDLQATKKDDYGSYFDLETQKWLDLSPVGKAMAKVEALNDLQVIENLDQQWNDILEFEDLQAIEDFQALSERLLSYICNATKYRKLSKPAVEIPKWLTGTILRDLEDRFGWAERGPVHRWQRSEAHWFKMVHEPYRKMSSAPTFHSRPYDTNVVARSSFRERILNRVRGLNLLILYGVYRLSISIVEHVP